MRPAHIGDLTPWTRAVVGEPVQLPRGYRITGVMSGDRHQFRFSLLLPDPDGDHPVRLASTADAARAAYAELVDLAYREAAAAGRCHYCGRPSELAMALGDRTVGLCGTCWERGREAVVVRADAEGWIESIEGAAS